MKNKHFLISATILSIMFLIAACNKDKEEKDKCLSITCENGGACFDGACDCPPHYSGARCQFIENPCYGITCQNGGTCNTGTCQCPDGFVGALCETEDWASNVTGAYVGEYLWEQTLYVSVAQVTKISPTRIRIETNISSTPAFEANIILKSPSGYAINIPYQSMQQSVFYIAGTSVVDEPGIHGAFHTANRQLSLTAYVSNGGNNYFMAFQGVK